MTDFHQTSSNKSPESNQEKKLQLKIFQLLEKQNLQKNELSDIKQTHRKQYLQQKAREYKSKWVREMIRFTSKEIEELTAIAKQYGIARAPFLKACIYGYLKDHYVLPDESKVRSLELSINQISGSIDQTVRHIYSNQQMSLDDLEAIKLDIHRLEEVISQTMRTPPNLKQWIIQQKQLDRSFVNRLIEIINEIENDY